MPYTFTSGCFVTSSVTFISTSSTAITNGEVVGVVVLRVMVMDLPFPLQK